MANTKHLSSDNLINVKEEDYSKKIYKIMPLEHLILMLSGKKLALAKTTSWEDVYENFLFKQEFEQNGDKIEAEHLAKIIFGQCWSLNSSSDALWRIYSQDKKSIMIRTTIRKLFDVVYTNENCYTSTYVGKVDYKKRYELNEWIMSNSPISLPDLDSLMIESLFLKRNNFSHEKEIRVIYRPMVNSPECGAKLLYYDINPIDFIEYITFDPRADDAYVSSIKDVISKYQFPLRRVRKSTLYSFKPNKIQII